MDSRKRGQHEINESSSSHLGLLVCSHNWGGSGHGVLLESRMNPGMLLHIL